MLVIQPSASNNASDTGRQLTRRNRTSYESLGLLDYVPLCLNSEERKRLDIDQDSRLPCYIYQLWVGRTTADESQDVMHLWRIYRSPALAKHDALCWLIARQNTAGASAQSYLADDEYEREHGGRCCRYWTDGDIYDELGMTFCAWTIEGSLY